MTIEMTGNLNIHVTELTKAPTTNLEGVCSKTNADVSMPSHPCSLILLSNCVTAPVINQEVTAMMFTLVT